MEYKVFMHDDIRSFTDKLNDALRNGWACQGGLTINGGTYYQAMTRYKPSANRPDETH